MQANAQGHNQSGNYASSCVGVEAEMGTDHHWLVGHGYKYVDHNGVCVKGRSARHAQYA